MKMQKTILGAALILGSYMYADVNAVVSILPQKTFVEKIGADKVNVSVMVQPGNSPHSYEPKPSQMKDIAKADIYFTIGVEFEDAWLQKFADQNKKMKIVSIAKDIDKIPMQEHHHHEEEADNDHDHDHESHENEHESHENEDDHDHEHGSLDPHVWTSPKNVKIIAKNILDYLVKIDTENQKFYTDNYEQFIAHIEQTDKEIQDILANTPKNSKFMIFHPAWGYFAKQYSLVQMPIELEGKAPKPKAITELIEEAKHEGVKAVFTNPEVSDKVAKQIASEVGVPVIEISPLNPKWSQNLKTFAKAIANR